MNEALASDDWRAAMDTEFDALMKNETWHLVPQSGQNIIDCKWVFKVKQKADGSIDHLKACLVAKGFKQWYGLDYEDIFSPVVKAVIIRLVLYLAMTNNWNIRQLDVQNMFLHGILEEDALSNNPLGTKTQVY
jgi:histone deacetylase 1/2